MKKITYRYIADLICWSVLGVVLWKYGNEYAFGAVMSVGLIYIVKCTDLMIKVYNELKAVKKFDQIIAIMTSKIIVDMEKEGKSPSVNAAEARERLENEIINSDDCEFLIDMIDKSVAMSKAQE